MKDDSLSDDKLPLQTSVLLFFILSTKSYWSWLELYDQYVIDFDIDFESHLNSLP